MKYIDNSNQVELPVGADGKVTADALRILSGIDEKLSKFGLEVVVSSGSKFVGGVLVETAYLDVQKKAIKRKRKSKNA